MNLLELRKTKANLELTLENLGQVNKEMESFAYIAAHDLKSPLHNISSLTDLFLKNYHSKIDKEGLQYIGMISSSADKLKKLIDGLLEYSKSSKILKENKSEINLQGLKNDIESLFNFKNNSSITLQSSLHTIFTNKTALEQILMNLVSNSIKYNDKSKTEIVIDIAEEEEKYIISVKDNGPGIPKEYQHKVFEIFEVFTNEDRFGQRGNGIGLALVKKIVEASGGSITVESETGMGAKFIFTLEKLSALKNTGYVELENS